MKDRIYTVTYEKDKFWKLDKHGLSMGQASNYKKTSDWFFPFRGGLNGFHARMAGAEHHYNLMHGWVPQPRSVKETEYHLASLFFHLDSAIECLVFTMNAIGYAVQEDGFHNINDDKFLRRISPSNILGRPQSRSGQLKGYLTIFPRTTALWASHIDMLNIIFEQHDVSKHRHIIYLGGSSRNDPPSGFWDSLEIPEEYRPEFAPVREVILGKNLKQPSKDWSNNAEEFVYLEEVVVDFFKFIDLTGEDILNDAIENIPL